MPAANKLVGDLSTTTPGTTTNPAPEFGWNPNTKQWVAHGGSGVAVGIVGSVNSGHSNVTALVKPTAVAHTGSNVTAVTPSGYDSAGKVAFTTPASPVAGGQVDVTFGTAFNTAPVVVFSVQTASSNVMGPFALTAVSTTGFTVGVNASTQVTASQTYTISYTATEVGTAS